MIVDRHTVITKELTGEHFEKLRMITRLQPLIQQAESEGCRSN